MILHPPLAILLDLQVNQYASDLTCGIIREAKEELGIDLKPSDLKMSLALHSAPHRENPHEIILFVFEAHNYQGEVRNMEPDKCDDIQFFDPKHLPENTLPAAKQALQAMEDGKHFIEMDWPKL